MKRRKKALLCAIIAAIVLSHTAPELIVPAVADTPITTEDALKRAISLYEDLDGKAVEVPKELLDEGYDKNIVKSSMLGYVNLDETNAALHNENIRKQDYISVLYKTIVHFDRSFSVSSDEADIILNECYDNAYIAEENRIAYAFMMKHGIITANYGTKPDSYLTKEECELMTDSVYDRFMKNTVFTVNGIDVTIGENAENITDSFGNPNRIDKTEYGFDWYVYNDDYSRFFMVGVQADRVCAFFSNSKAFELGNIKEGCDYSMTADYEDNRCFRFYPTKDGKVDGMLYCSAYRGIELGADVKRSKSLILLDMINANRSKNIKPLYAEDSKLSANTWLSTFMSVDNNDNTTTQKGYDIFEVYGSLVENEDNILTQDTDYVTAVGITSATDMAGDTKSTITSDTDKIATLEKRDHVEIPEKNYWVSDVDEVKTPVLSQPQTETEYNEGDDITIELEERAARKYHVEMFDVENDEYAVNEYVVTDQTQMTIPHDLLTAGRDYKIIVSAITNDGEALSSDEVLVSYGSAYETGVQIVAPYNDGILDGDTLEVTWKSDAYHDFYVDLYNQDGELLVSEIVEGKQEALIQGLDDGGTYFLYVTALRRGTRVEKAQDMVSFTLELPKPVINEYILDKDETYYYVYEDEDMGLLYFYDEDIVEVEENGKKVKKKKIIQKQVKSTRGYRKLARKRSTPIYTTGDPNFRAHSVPYDGTMGSRIVQEASRYLGVPYVWGGETPEGFDCSGLVLYVMNTLGINVNRVAEDQFNNGVAVNRDELQPGDLLFFEQNGYIHHVGIYAGDGMMIHAPHTGDVVKYQSIDDDYYVREYAGARRVY